MPRPVPTGRFPHATLYVAQTEGFDAAVKMQRKYVDLSKKYASEYVRKCIVTKGEPHMIDLYEDEGEKVE
jgi:hypothetical protein